MIDYKNRIKVIGFDLDQTLYPKSPEIDDAIQEYIYHKISAFKKCAYLEARGLFKNLYQNGKGLSGRKTLIALGLPEDESKNIIQEALEKADISKFLKPDNETISLLKKLKEKYFAIDLITGSSMAVAKEKLNHLNIPFEIFSHYITEDIASKSDGAAYYCWMNSYIKFGPGEFLYIGDNLNDYLIPKKLGINSILVNIRKKDDVVDCLQLEKFNGIKSLLL